jgi:hypothetical protein
MFYFNKIWYASANSSDSVHGYMHSDISATFHPYPEVMYSHGSAIVPIVSLRLPAAARVRTWVRSCGICGGQSGTGAVLLRILGSPMPIIPPIAPRSGILGQNSGRRTKCTQSQEKKFFIQPVFYEPPLVLLVLILVLLISFQLKVVVHWAVTAPGNKDLLCFEVPARITS